MPPAHPSGTPNSNKLNSDTQNSNEIVRHTKFKHSWINGKYRMKASEPERSSKDRNVPAFWQCYEFSVKTPQKRSMITCLKTDNCNRALDATAIDALLPEEMHVKEIYLNSTSTLAWSNVSVGPLMWRILWIANIRKQLQTCWGRLNLALLTVRFIGGGPGKGRWTSQRTIWISPPSQESKNWNVVYWLNLAPKTNALQRLRSAWEPLQTLLN